MIAHVIDDLFDHAFITKLEETILDKIPVYTTNIANSRSYPKGRKGGTHRICGIDIFSRSTLNRVDTLHPHAEGFFDAFEVIEEMFEYPLQLYRIDLNLQHMGMDGSPHVDSHEYTIMLMNNSEWKPEWGGQFQIMSDDWKTVLEEYEYVPGRVLMFPSDVPHRGLAPSDKSVYRYSTVFRVIVDEEQKSSIHPRYIE